MNQSTRISSQERHPKQCLAVSPSEAGYLNRKVTIAVTSVVAQSSGLVAGTKDGGKDCWTGLSVVMQSVSLSNLLAIFAVYEVIG